MDRVARMRVLVTGASGFVGRATCAELLDRGHDVLALVRRPGSEPAGTRAVAGDLTSGETLRGAIRDAAPEGVVHLAAEIASQRDEGRIRDVNVEGTRRLVDALLAQPRSSRLVFTSTVVTGHAGGALLTPDEPLPVTTPYGRSKQEGERIVLDSGLPAVVVRPSHVYGPGGWYADEIIPLLRRPGRFAIVGRGANLWDVVHVEDVARACVDALERAPAGAVYHCADDEPLTYRAFMELTASALGTGSPRPIPLPLARLAVGRHTVTTLVRSARSSNERLKQDLGWQPRYPTAREGIPAAVAALAQTA
jgi:nucleoside-diphosphate-sugar epimerase